jgi:hypothetical protein
MDFVRAPGKCVGKAEDQSPDEAKPKNKSIGRKSIFIFGVQHCQSGTSGKDEARPRHHPKKEIQFYAHAFCQSPIPVLLITLAFNSKNFRYFVLGSRGCNRFVAGLLSFLNARKDKKSK